MKYLLYATALTFMLIPVQFALSPAEGFDVSILRIVIPLIACAFCVISFAQRKFFIPRGWISLSLTGFLMWMIFSLFYSPVIEWTIRKTLFLFTIFPLFYVLVALFIEKSTYQWIIVRSAVIGGFFAAIIGIVQFLAQFIFPLNTILSSWTLLTPFFLGGTFSETVSTYNSWLVNVGGHDMMRAVAFFPDPHMYSFYLSACAFLSLSLYAKYRQNLWVIITTIIFLADLLTFSRGGYIGLLGASLVGILLFWQNISVRLKHFSLLFLITATFIFIIPHNPVSERFYSSFSQADTSVTHRIELWTRAFEEIAQRPFFGTGLGAYAHIVDPLAGYRTPIYVHNLFLDIFVEVGVIGLIFFTCLIASTFFILISHRAQYDIIFVIMALSAFVFHSLFDTALFSLHVLPILILIFARAAYYENIQQK